MSYRAFPLSILVLLVGCSSDSPQPSADGAVQAQDTNQVSSDTMGDVSVTDATTNEDASNNCSPVTGLTSAQMVAVPAGFEIDKTEVTQAQYAAWLAASPDPSCQPAQCSWNTSFVPDEDCLAGLGMFGMNVCQGQGCDNHPQVCIDWCDAYTYCHAVDKHLCGRIGGGILSYEDYHEAAQSEWVNACSSGGKHAYSYGDDYIQDTCNDFESGIETTVEVGSLPGCVSSEPGYEGILDMVGNVSELTDSCREATQQELDNAKQNGSTDTPDMQARCHLGSGSFSGLPDYSTCQADNEANRSLVLGNMGFRCCR